MLGTAKIPGYDHVAGSGASAGHMGSLKCPYKRWDGGIPRPADESPPPRGWPAKLGPHPGGAPP